MGMWFSNLHIRKNEVTTADAVEQAVCKLMDEKGYCPALSEADAEVAVAILTSDRSQWFSVHSEALMFEEPDDFAEMAMPMSTELQTDIMGISCFDSDYLYLNLIHTELKKDAWVGIGEALAYDMERQTELAAWETEVTDFPRFSECARTEYVFAEDFLREVQDCLSLPASCSAVDYDYIQEMEQELKEKCTIQYLYFRTK